MKTPWQMSDLSVLCHTHKSMGKNWGWGRKTHRTNESQRHSLRSVLIFLNHELWNKNSKLWLTHTENKLWIYWWILCVSAPSSLSLLCGTLQWSILFCSCWALDQFLRLPTTQQELFLDELINKIQETTHQHHVLEMSSTPVQHFYAVLNTTSSVSPLMCD